MSSAYLMSIDISSSSRRFLSKHVRPFITCSMNILNRLGDMMQPCLTPILTGNQSVSCPPAIIAQFVSLYKFFIIVTYFWGMPIWIIIFQSASLQIVSNAALKSIKWICSGTWCSLAFSIICLTMNIASIVPLPGLNEEESMGIYIEFNIEGVLNVTINKTNKSPHLKQYYLIYFKY